MKCDQRLLLWTYFPSFIYPVSSLTSVGPCHKRLLSFTRLSYLLGLEFL